MNAPLKSTTPSIGYMDDFAAWAMEQAELIRTGAFSRLDVENVVEELESLGRSQRHELFKRYAVLLAHLLKWRYQPGRQGASWRNTVWEQRTSIAALIEDSPSLKAIDEERFQAAWRLARVRAAEETGVDLDLLPETNPFTREQALDTDFWPEPPLTK